MNCLSQKMKFLLPALLFWCMWCNAQSYATLQSELAKLHKLAEINDPAERELQSKNAIERLANMDMIPMTAQDSAVFIYYGEAKSVEWTGDFNRWGFDKSFNSKGKRISGTNIWLLRASFPSDARLDYKVILNDNLRILDPYNKRLQWSGVGGGSPNSELRMPAYKDDPAQTYRSGIAHGTVSEDILYTSSKLSYQITYNVYIPAVADPKNLPVVYVTDGYEYLHPQLGNMATVLDNLIADNKIVPIAAIFVDHREPANRMNNRRMDELVMNENYLNFFVDEFIPYLEATYPFDARAESRAILGASVGGLNATYFTFARPDIFSKAGIQSPSYFTRPQIYALCDNPDLAPITVSMTSGLIHDASDGGRKMTKILENNSCTYHYRETNQGHSWGNWRDTIDDILVDFFAPK